MFGFASKAPAASLPPPHDLNFTVMREGDAIGTHVMKFRQNGDVLNVDIVTDVAVKLAFITVYRFEHKGVEGWNNGNLLVTSTVSNDDGTNHVLKAQAEGDQLVVNGNGEVHKTPVGIMPASLWNPEIVKHNVLLNTLHGKHMKVTVDDLGDESVTVKGASVAARHYVINGELERELWFDKAGTLVQVRFKGEDKSEILYVLL
ncbi:MAG: hypothetical protein A3G18_08270 [Rhodospirillales bacterium RIFCSPLOWO2_12_FULL_58_28]|nr:MAG: hypothetical protein A3H92_09665 [Rhodospirillales bacterium RIFCSPLOWO2_02_FULL_58_16]OHC79133.1 MAG: hypothetical protein A3G18_08270 [Rhodospirillales bacterium RIFCSPLOWO2_12_FULL_58_28]